MRNESFKKEVWIGTGVILLSIILFTAGSALLSSSLADHSKRISEDRAKLAEQAALFANLADIKNNIQIAKAYKQKLDNLLPTQEQLLEFPQVLNTLAPPRNLALTFLFNGVAIPPKENFPGTIPFSLDINGPLDQINSFLNVIETKATRFLITIDNFDLSSAQNNNYHLVFQGQAYFQ